MLNIFPTMFLSLIAHALLRLFAGSILVFLGFKHFSRRDDVKNALSGRWPRVAAPFALSLGAAEILIGAMFIAGIYTQIAALLAVLFAVIMLILRKTLAYPLVPQPLFFVLLAGTAVSLFITGAGAFAFDIPL